MSEGCWLHRLERRGERDHWYNGIWRGAGTRKSSGQELGKAFAAQAYRSRP